MPSRTPTRSRVTVQEESSVAILKIAVEEQRRFHDELTHSFNGHRTKIVYFIGATLAIMTFLYSGATDTAKTISQRLFIPDELYGIIFYVFGLSSLIFALFTLIKGARPDTQWHVPSETIEKKVIGTIDNKITNQEFLQSLVNEYEESSTTNLVVHTRKSEAVKTAFFPLLVGAIVLIVLRFFQ